MSKKRKYKKVYKGIRYIKKYYPKRYVDSRKRHLKSAEVLSSLRKSKEKVILKNIFKYTKLKPKIPGKPELSRLLTIPMQYFELENYVSLIKTTTNEIYFISEISPIQTKVIRGGDEITYREYFYDYVDFCNIEKAETDPIDNAYETDWLVKCTDPIFNEQTKRWETNIITVNIEGDYFDYGFIPKGAPISPRTSKLSGIKKPTKVEPSISKTQISDIEAQEKTKQIQAQEKTKQLELLRADFKDGVYTKDEYKIEREKIISK